MRTRVRRKRGTGEKNYNLQGWVDVRKIVQIINGIEHLGTSVDSMSDLCRLMVDLTSDMFWSKYSIPMPDTIEEAYEWLQANRYTVAQIEPNDRRVRTIKNAFEDDAMFMEKANEIGRKYAPGLIAQEDKIELVGPSKDKFPIEPEEHRGTCNHRGLILDDGINCNKCHYFVPNES